MPYSVYSGVNKYHVDLFKTFQISMVNNFSMINILCKHFVRKPCDRKYLRQLQRAMDLELKSPRAY